MKNKYLKMKLGKNIATAANLSRAKQTPNVISGCTKQHSEGF